VKHHDEREQQALFQANYRTSLSTGMMGYGESKEQARYSKATELHHQQSGGGHHKKEHQRHPPPNDITGGFNGRSARHGFGQQSTSYSSAGSRNPYQIDHVMR
jgi:hypothetical protein